jgi:MFS family permease
VSDRLGRRIDRLMIAGIATWTLGMAGLALARDFAGYVGAELVVGAGQALFVPAAATLIAGAAGGARLGRSTARFTVASSLGRTSGTLIAGAILAAVMAGAAALPGLPQAWRVVFLLTALPNVLVLIALAAARPVAAHRHDVAARGEPLDWPAALRWAGAFLVATAPVLLIQAVAGWYPTLLVRIARLTPADAAMAAGAAMLLAAPAGQWLGGVALDRRPEWRQRAIGVIATMLAVAGAALAAVALTPTPTLAVALVALAVVDLALGVAALAALTSIQARAPAAGRRCANSLFFALVTIAGVGGGPLLAGRLSDLGGAGGGALARALTEVAAIAVIVALAGEGLARSAAWRPALARLARRV